MKTYLQSNLCEKEWKNIYEGKQELFLQPFSEEKILSTLEQIEKALLELETKISKNLSLKEIHSFCLHLYRLKQITQSIADTFHCIPKQTVQNIQKQIKEISLQQRKKILKAHPKKEDLRHLKTLSFKNGASWILSHCPQTILMLLWGVDSPLVLRRILKNMLPLDVEEDEPISHQELLKKLSREFEHSYQRDLKQIPPNEKQSFMGQWSRPYQSITLVDERFYPLEISDVLFKLCPLDYQKYQQISREMAKKKDTGVDLSFFMLYKSKRGDHFLYIQDHNAIRSQLPQKEDEGKGWHFWSPDGNTFYQMEEVYYAGSSQHYQVRFQAEKENSPYLASMYVNPVYALLENENTYYERVSLEKHLGVLQLLKQRLIKIIPYKKGRKSLYLFKVVGENIYIQIDHGFAYASDFGVTLINGTTTKKLQVSHSTRYKDGASLSLFFSPQSEIFIGGQKQAPLSYWLDEKEIKHTLEHVNVENLKENPLNLTGLLEQKRWTMLDFSFRPRL